MLTNISVANYALIDQLELDLKSGFTSLTGETGAGKSIILGALGLILGDRADIKALSKSERKCIIEGTFTLDNSYKNFFKTHDLDFERQTIIRREITPSGKSRAFINDTPIKLQLLNSLAMHLIDVHSQHQNLLLNNLNFQLELIDAFASNNSTKDQYQKEYKQYQHLLKEQGRLQAVAQSELGDADYLQFLFDELEEAKLVPGEQEELEQDLEKMENSELIQANLEEALALADGEEASAGEQLKRIKNALKAVQKFDPEVEQLTERIESLVIELDDIRLELEGKSEQTDFNPTDQAQMDERLSTLIALQKKHSCANLEELITKKNSLENRIAEITKLEENLQKLTQNLEKQQQQLLKAAKNLSLSRKKVTPKLEAAIKKILADLNMPYAQLKINLQASNTFSASGKDSVVYLFSANKGAKPEPLHKIASGGEMSRVMLAIKSIMATTRSLPTIIFDEIDTGVSGETAGKIGQILKDMGRHMQVISITHLPQIAALGKQHLYVYKSVTQNRTFTHIKELQKKERLSEIARLLSGNKITKAALSNAENLLNQ
jgi:DNA repair protein RecN (Recombination protein N)